MAVLKHIKSRNANYSKVIDYLLFQHDRSTGKMIKDDFGCGLLREEFYMDGINCDPMSFDKECKRTNFLFHKNQRRSEIKNHHYIISFDPADATECDLTGPKAQALSLKLAKKMFPGYQAIVVTHTDGHHESGNIHTHIVINSVRKNTARREAYMTQLHDHEAGFKHRSTDKFLKYFKQEVMEMCQREGLHQIDLMAPAEVKINQKEYMAQQSGQKKLEKTNQKIIEDGFNPTSSVFLTQKQELRNAIDACATVSKNFEDFQSKLLEQYHISVIEQRGRYSYLHPGRQKRITERALGTNYGKQHLEQLFLQKDPFVIFYIHTNLRLLVDLQTNVKAMQSPAYAQKVKISNLKEMANTMIFVQQHGYNTQEELQKSFSQMKAELEDYQNQLINLSSDWKALNDQIRYTGSYYANKKVHDNFLKSKMKGIFRKVHESELQAYEKARDWLKSYYQDGKMIPLKSLNSQKRVLQKEIEKQRNSIQSIKNQCKEMDSVIQNIDSILHMEVPKKQKSIEQER